MGAVRGGDLPDEAGLAHPGLADDGHDLAVACRRLAERAAQLLQLALPRAAATRSRERSGPVPTSSYTSTGLSNPFTGTGPSGLTST
jgi:hypothetical protein